MQADDDELSMEVGNVITIVDKADEHWWRGELHGNVGIFPSNFVEEIEGSPPAARDQVNVSSSQEDDQRMFTAA